MFYINNSSGHFQGSLKCHYYIVLYCQGIQKSGIRKKVGWSVGNKSELASCVFPERTGVV